MLNLHLCKDKGIFKRFMSCKTCNTAMRFVEKKQPFKKWYEVALTKIFQADFK